MWCVTSDGSKTDFYTIKTLVNFAQGSKDCYIYS